uniref:Uncharacterized protein n=1 Tax=viral metagenome TaxID=1070528 RepID=A0A6C0IZK5_9ZZZZ
MILDYLTDTTRIARAIANKKNFASIMRVRCCPCLTPKEAKIYAGALLPDLGPEFKLRIQEGA